MHILFKPGEGTCIQTASVDAFNSALFAPVYQQFNTRIGNWNRFGLGAGISYLPSCMTHFIHGQVM